MSRRHTRFALILLAISWIPCSLLGDSFRLLNGDLIEGEPISFDERGVVFRKPDQNFSDRVGWTNFPEQTLKQLDKYPEARPFVGELTLPEEALEEEAAEQEIRPRPVPRLARLDPDAGFGAMFASPLSLTLLILIYVANIYAGFEVAIFRNYPAWVVCLAAALFPVVGPVVFLCLPTYVPAAPEPVYEMPVDQYAQEAEAVEETAPAEAAPPPPPSQTIPKPVVYQRGTTSFNRRFVETKLAKFMKVVPSEEDKDMVLVVKSARGEHVASRISRVSPNDFQLQIDKGGASADVTVPYTDIREIMVCHKEVLEKT